MPTPAASADPPAATDAEVDPAAETHPPTIEAADVTPTAPAHPPALPGADITPTAPAHPSTLPGADITPTAPAHPPTLPGADITPTAPAHPPTLPGADITPNDPARPPTLPGAVGILLAAGAGRRMGRPKALVVGDDGEPWLLRGVRVLREAGCAEVVVVLGAEAVRAHALLANPEVAIAASAADGAPAAAGAEDVRVTVVEAADWSEGIGASLRAGIAAVAGAGAPAAGRGETAGTDGQGDDTVADGLVGAPVIHAIVTLVDLPHLRPDAIRRLAAGATKTTLRQATYAGRPGHPVVIGSAHFAALGAALHGDLGARPYLLAHGVEAVDCTDLGGGDDVDAPHTDPRPRLPRESGGIEEPRTTDRR